MPTQRQFLFPRLWREIPFCNIAGSAEQLQVCRIVCAGGLPFAGFQGKDVVDVIPMSAGAFEGLSASGALSMLASEHLGNIEGALFLVMLAVFIAVFLGVPQTPLLFVRLVPTSGFFRVSVSPFLHAGAGRGRGPLGVSLAPFSRSFTSPGSYMFRIFIAVFPVAATCPFAGHLGILGVPLPHVLPDSAARFFEISGAIAGIFLALLLFSIPFSHAIRMRITASNFQGL